MKTFLEKGVNRNSYRKLGSFGEGKVKNYFGKILLMEEKTKSARVIGECIRDNIEVHIGWSDVGEGCAHTHPGLHAFVCVCVFSVAALATSPFVSALFSLSSFLSCA